jgi:hypothetical protein
MNIDEIDWRIEPLHDVIVGLDAGLEAIRKRSEEEEYFDAGWALDFAEPLFGVGFVVAQTYALGTWTDLNRIRASAGKLPLDKRHCYASDPITVVGGATRIETIHAVANYFKHHDEWSQWPKNETTRLLDKIGITQDTELPCVEAVNLLCGNTWKLIVIHQILIEWRAHVMGVLR